MSVKPHGESCMCTTCGQWYKDRYQQLQNDRYFKTALKIYMAKRNCGESQSQDVIMKNAMREAYIFVGLFDNGV